LPSADETQKEQATTGSGALAAPQALQGIHSSIGHWSVQLTGRNHLDANLLREIWLKMNVLNSCPILSWGRTDGKN